MSNATAVDALTNHKAGNEAATKSRNGEKAKSRKWKLPVGIGIALLALLWWFTRDVLPEWQAEKEKQTQAAAKTASQKPAVAPQDNLGTTRVLVVTDMPSDEIFLPNNRCFRAWGIDPDGGMDPDLKAVHTEVRGHNKDRWYSWEEFQKLREEKKVSFEYPAWARFSAKEDVATVHYTFYDLRSSRCPKR